MNKITNQRNWDEELKDKYYFVSNDKESKIVQGHKNAKMRYEGGEYTSCSGGYDSIEELKSKCGIPEWKCKICNQIYSTNYIEPTKTRLLENHTCFNCDFWLGYTHKTNKSLRINGSHYMVGTNKTPDRWNGYGGSKFKIKKNTGEIIETCDLWHQGTIPEYFRKELFDNAEFVK